MLTPTIPRNWRSSSHTEQAAFGIDSTKSAPAPPPIAAHDTLDFFSSPEPLLPFAEHGGHTPALAWILEPLDLHTLYPHKDVASGPPLQKADPPRFRPTWVPAVSHHVSGLRLRLMTAGFHSRRPKGFAWSHFFPRSVGFGPTVSSANGALTIDPSMLCHRQAIPSTSSYSASPLRQRRTKTFFRFHSTKYLWDGTRAAIHFFRKCFPLATGSQHIYNTSKNLPWVHGLSASARSSKVFFGFQPLMLWNQRLNPLPKLLGYGL